MRLLRLAIEEQRWDLAAHTIVLATAKVLISRRKVKLSSGDKGDAARKNKASKEQS